MGGIIATVEPDSIASEVGLRPGDEILAIDGTPLRDLIDFRYLSAEERLELHLRAAEGDRLIDIEKDWAEEIGVEFESPVFDGVRECNNRCAFCFVEQSPPGMRPTSVIHDDDYRLSFLCGNFVTLSNLTAQDLQRILDLRLSPLYVSVHATEPSIRARLFRSANHQAGLDNLRCLAAEGIECHCQIVVCPGVNDGSHLERTVAGLADLWPGVPSVGVVPVGLTAHRDGLVPLRSVGPEEARAALALIEGLQPGFLTQRGTRFVFGADELYLMAGSALPDEDEYEDYPQLENGVGLCRPFFGRLRALVRGPRATKGPRVLVVTGRSAAPLLEECLAPLGHRVLPVENTFFGPTVTVAGLLAGRDVLNALEQGSALDGVDRVLVPRVALDARERFIDSVTLADLRSASSTPILVTETPDDIRAALDGSPEKVAP